MFIYVSLALVAITALFVLFNLLKGLIRGFKKTIGTIIAIVISAIIAAIVTAIICDPKSELMVMVIDTLKGMISGGELDDILGIEELGEAITYYISMIAAPFVFMVLYMVISIIVSIIVGIVVRIMLRHKKSKGALHRLGGLGLGVVAGLLVSAIMLMPIVGVLKTVIAVGDSELFAAEGEESEITELIDEANNDTIFKIYSVSSGWMFDALASVQVGNKRVYLKTELEVIMEIVNGIGAISGEAESFTTEQVDAIGGVVTSLDKSPILKSTVAALLSQMASKWVAGETFMGIDKIDAGELVNPLLDTILEVMATSDEENITDDMNTFVGILRVLAENKILESMDDFEGILSILSSKDAAGDTPISKLLKVANDNERMLPLSDEIAKLSVRALASTLGIPNDNDARYNMLMNDIADAINGSGNAEDRQQFVEAEVIDALNHYGLEIAGDAARDIASSLLSDLGGKGHVDADMVKEFFKLYAVASITEGSIAAGYGAGYAALAGEDINITENENGELVMGDYVFKHYGIYDYRSSAAYRAGADGISFGDGDVLYSAAALDTKSDLITLSDVLDNGVKHKFRDLDDTVKDADGKTEQEREIDHIANMLTKAATIDFDADYTVLIKGMGTILDEMSYMQLIGDEATALLLEAIFQSEMCEDLITENKLEDKIQKIIDTSKEGSYENTTIVLGTLLGTVKGMSNKDASSEEMLANTKELILTIDENTADLVKDMLSEEMMKGYVEDEEKAEVASNTMNTLVDNMAALPKDHADHDTEAAAVNTIIDLTTNATSSEEKRLFTKDGQAGKIESDPDNFVDLLASSIVASDTIKETLEEEGNNPYGLSLSEEDKTDLTNALVNRYANPKEDENSEELAQTLTDIANLMSVEPPEFN